MQVIFVGGAQGVGASCLALELAGQWIVVDAGVRVDRKADPLPDLALLEDKDVRAIFVTHAHADHIGSLPLLHQAFPTTPIFTSRGTALLMEVMLADALKIMAKRAAEEMELPLYPETLISTMLARIRPLPVGEPFSVSELDKITIHASRAGHIAGAVSLGFVAPEGSIVVSGDISITPQRTVLGAVAPPVERPDLLVLESTYGARMHPNRQAEELRLAQAVAEGLTRGGHVLIPAFGLGRGQELLLILRAAQEKGQIPLFPIYVDGLVRRVCSTYMLLPEALSPVLQRQIRRGYEPFSGGEVAFVRDERERERILAGPPACIVSSSGMLTGGPSAWYAARLAGREDSSIFITGYQDEESPGKRLLDLAERKTDALEVGGMQVQVNCTVAKYSLSAHADGGELAAYAASLHPKQVALVHGDEDSRHALRPLLGNIDVILPANGQVLELGKHRPRTVPQQSIPAPELPRGIGEGRIFETEDLEELWLAVRSVPTLRIVTARELAQIWYDEPDEVQTVQLLMLLEDDWDQRYFVHQHGLAEAFRVRGQQEESPGDFLYDLVDKVVLLQVSSESSKPALCRSLEPGASVRVILPRGISLERNRFPLSALLDVLGDYSEEVQGPQTSVAGYLAELVKSARRVRRVISAHELAQRCQEGVDYTLGDICTLAGVSARAVEDRLAVAKVLQQHPLLFAQQASLLEGEGLALYRLTPDWREGLRYPEKRELPDQNEILRNIEFAIGNPPQLYRRSVNPETGDVTLYFHFPEPARREFETALEDAASATGVSITIAPNAHQGELANVAKRLLQEEGLTLEGTPSLYQERQALGVRTMQALTPEQIADLQEHFNAETGWTLELSGGPNTPAAGQTIAPSARLQAPAHFRVPQQVALSVAQGLLSHLPDCYKVGVDPRLFTIPVRFYYPDAARQRYAHLFTQIEEETGWRLLLHPHIHQEALIRLARQLTPEGLSCKQTPSLYVEQHQIYFACEGSADKEAIAEAKRRFKEETAWQLEFALPDTNPTQETRISQAEALVTARELFLRAADLYHIGADSLRRVLWLHFRFPERARIQYAETLAQLAEQTGWKVELNPQVQQSALLDAAKRVLPQGVSSVGKGTLDAEQKTLGLICSAQIEPQTRQEIQQRFNEETGWQLQLFVPAG